VVCAEVNLSVVACCVVLSVVNGGSVVSVTYKQVRYNRRNRQYACNVVSCSLDTVVYKKEVSHEIIKLKRIRPKTTLHCFTRYKSYAV